MTKSTGCGLFVFLLVAALGYTAWRILTPPRLDPGVPLSQLPPAQREQRRADAKQLETQVNEIVRAGHERRQQTFTLEISAEQLNTLLQDRVDTRKFPIQDLRVGLQPGQLLVQGKAKVSGFSGVATLSGGLTAQNGKLQFTTQDLKIGGISAPDKWQKKVNQSLTQRLNDALNNAPGRIDKVTIETDKMIVSGNSG